MRSIFIGLWIVLCALGCSDSLESPDLVNNLRILAIESTPANPYPNDTLTLSAVLANPAQETVQYQWSLCLLPTSADNGYTCPNIPTEAGLPSLGLGLDMAQPTLVVPQSIPENILKTLCNTLTTTLAYNTLSDRTFACTETYPLQVTLTVTTPSYTRTAVRTVRLFYNTSQTRIPAPVILGVSFTASPRNASSAFTELTNGTKLKANIPYDLEITHQDPEEKQRIDFAWYTTHGSFEETKDRFDSGFSFSNPSNKNTWTYDEDAPPPKQVQFWFIAQDNRGSTTWATRIVEVE
jgi:hypothetical protein